MDHVRRRLIRRLALSVSLAWIGIQISAALGSVILLRLAGGRLEFVGLPFFIVNVGSALAAYPAGHLMDRHGRRPVLVGGHILGAAGFIVGGLAILAGSLPLFLAGVTVSSFGAGATYLVRLAAADLFPPERRARGISLVVVAATVGAVLGTPFTLLAQELAPVFGVSYLLVAWSMAALLSLLAAGTVSGLRPDPKEVGAQLQAVRPMGNLPASAHERSHSRRSLLSAGLCLAFSQAAMVFVMSAVPGHLDHIGQSAQLISLTMSAHIVGMFLFSPLVGHAADRWGRKATLVAGALILLASTAAIAFVPLGQAIAAALFAVGLGWSCSFVGASVVVADAFAVAQRGRATAVADGITASLAAVASLTTGLALAEGGIAAVGSVGLALSGLVLASSLLLSGPARLAEAGLSPSETPKGPSVVAAGANPDKLADK